jgi:hypothetical protein
MTDLRKAAEMALDWFEGCQVNGIDDTHEAAVAAAEALRQALAQPEQEPVGYVSESGKGAYILLGAELDDGAPLYAEPPNRKWVELTDEEAREIRLKVGSASDVYARAIGAALKEKNGG